MARTPDMDPIVAAIASELTNRDPGCILGGVIVSAELIDSDGAVVHAFMNNGVDRATETLFMSARLQALAHEPLPLPEETD